MVTMPRKILAIFYTERNFSTIRFHGYSAQEKLDEDLAELESQLEDPSQTVTDGSTDRPLSPTNPFSVQMVRYQKTQYYS